MSAPSPSQSLRLADSYGFKAWGLHTLMEDHPDFLMYISIMPVKSLTENTKEPWFKAYFKLPK